VIDQKHELIGYAKKHLLSGQGGVRQPDPIAANHDLGLPGDPLVDSIHNESCGRVSARGPENKTNHKADLKSNLSMVNESKRVFATRASR
jgi:hypothetical protein